MSVDGIRRTAARDAIVSAIDGMGKAFTADSLARSLAESDTYVGTATVYRALSALSASGYIEKVGTRDGAALFCRCDSGEHHHHHVVCDGCGKVEITACALDAELSPAGSVEGFVITGHELVLHGLCPECVTGGQR